MTFSLSMTTMNANQKLETKTFPAFVDPMANEPSSTGTTASVTVDSDGMQRIYFPEPLHFLLDPTPHEGVSIQFDVYKQQQPPKKGPLWKVKSVSANFEKSFEMHNASAPMKLTSNRAENATIKFRDLFPVVVAPTANLHNALIKTELDPTTTAKMYPPLVSYFVERRLSNQMLTMTSFRRLFALVITADERFGLWIEHYFTPEPGCAAEFLRLVIENLEVIEEYPMHFFSLVFKSMRFEQAKLGDAFDFGPLSLLFTAVATRPLNDRVKILKSSGDFLLQLRMSCPTARFHKIAYDFLIQLSELGRLEIYYFLLSDIFFVRSITLLPSFSLSRPMSAFIPLLSLLYTTINTIFIQNKQDQIRKAAQTLSFLTSTLEHYANGRMAYEISRSLFPLLQQIFTFYDSLRDKLEKDMSPFGPIILFLLRNCDTRQFVLYFGILPPDNQLKFFEFLTGLSEGDMISAVARATNLLELNVTHEITCRVLRCVTFVSKRLIPEDSKGHLENFFKLLTHLLCANSQPSASFHIIFAAMAHFVNEFRNEIFLEKTNLIIELLTHVVAITEHKSIARSEAIGFIMWILDQEKRIRPSMTRCRLAIEYAVCTACFSTGASPFWEFLPSELSREVAGFYERLLKGMNSDKTVLYENQVRELLKLHNEFKNFPSIRGRIYGYIVRLNEEHGEHCSAFIAQWKLSALIAEVFKLRGQVIAGIPPEGSAGFRFIVNEPEVDLSEYPEDSRYLVLQSDMFTEEYFSDVSQKAVDLCQQAGVHWLIGDVTEVLFNYLEKQRQFVLLNALYKRVKDSFAELSKSESIHLGFARIFVTGKAKEKLQFSEAIHMFKYTPTADLGRRKTLDASTTEAGSKYEAVVMKMDGLTRFIQAYTKPLIGPDLPGLKQAVQPILETTDQKFCQIIDVKCIRADLLKLAATTFIKDVMGRDRGWDNVMVQRYIFETQAPLPSCIPVVEIKHCTIHEITKSVYYEEKLKRFREKLKAVVHRIRAVLPPPRVAKLWSHVVLGLSIAPILKFVAKIMGPQLNQPYYIWVRDVFTGAATEDAPPRIAIIIHEIRDLFAQALKLVEPLIAISAWLPGDQDMIKRFASHLSVSIRFGKS
jgi:hypothetical protein